MNHFRHRVESMIRTDCKGYIETLLAWKAGSHLRPLKLTARLIADAIGTGDGTHKCILSRPLTEKEEEPVKFALCSIALYQQTCEDGLRTNPRLARDLQTRMCMRLKNRTLQLAE